MLVDCGPGYGCDGGWTDYALDFLIESGGAQAEADYPYTAGVDEEAGLYIWIFAPNVRTLWHIFLGTCKFDNSAIVATLSSYDTVMVWYEGTDGLAQSINDNGPHATYLYVNDNFRNYAYGIFDDPSCPTNTYNHAVINVGYDTDAGYWLIRNSWGSGWGDLGHIKMAIGKNTCNVENNAWVPKI